MIFYKVIGSVIHVNLKTPIAMFSSQTTTMKLLASIIVLGVGLAGCNDEEEYEVDVGVGFTANLHEPQPHLTIKREVPGNSEVFRKVFYQQDQQFLEQIRDAGYDYLELNTTELAQLSSAQFAEAVTLIEDVGLEVPVTNLFLPGDIKVVGPDTDVEEQESYLEVAFTRLSQLGTEYVVFGSAGARYIPEDFPEEEAWDQLVDFSRRAAEMSEEYGITILIEHLRREETNSINSVAEAFELMQEVDHPHFEIMIDFYHLAEEEEDPDIVLEVADYLHHLHMANPEGRAIPQQWDEHPYYNRFFQNLRDIGYDQRISIEAEYTDLYEESQRSIEMMRQAFDPDFDLAEIP